MRQVPIKGLTSLAVPPADVPIIEVPSPNPGRVSVVVAGVVPPRRQKRVEVQSDRYDLVWCVCGRRRSSRNNGARERGKTKHASRRERKGCLVVKVKIRKAARQVLKKVSASNCARFVVVAASHPSPPASRRSIRRNQPQGRPRILV